MLDIVSDPDYSRKYNEINAFLRFASVFVPELKDQKSKQYVWNNAKH